MQDNNEDGGHDQNEGVGEAGVPPPLPPRPTTKCVLHTEKERCFLNKKQISGGKRDFLHF